MERTSPQTAQPLPYADLPLGAQWPDEGAPDLSTLYRPRVAITRKHRLATLGTSIAAHLHEGLVQQGFTVLNMEPPLPGMPPKLARRYGYGQGSARVGALRSARGLAQLVKDARRLNVRPEDAWARDGRWFDALRPEVEPDGLPRQTDVLAARMAHLRQVRRLLNRAEVLFVTLGACEDWVAGDTAYPQCPGMTAGVFTPDTCQLHRPDTAGIRADLDAAWDVLQRMNPELKLVLSLCPLPLRQTATGQHILTATADAQTALRHAATGFARDTPGIDLFPGHDLLSHAPDRTAMLEPDMSDLSPRGSAQLLQLFLAGQGVKMRENRTGRAA